MTVSELIEKLQTFDPSLEVVYGYAGDEPHYDISPVAVTIWDEDGNARYVVWL
jgi:hypothetical protein